LNNTTTRSFFLRDGAISESFMTLSLWLLQKIIITHIQ